MSAMKPAGIGGTGSDQCMRRIAAIRLSQRRRRLDKIFEKINDERPRLWRAVGHEGEALETFVTRTRDRKAALKFLRIAMRKHGRPDIIVSGWLRSYGAAIKEIGSSSPVSSPFSAGRSLSQRNCLRFSSCRERRVQHPSQRHGVRYLLRQ